MPRQKAPSFYAVSKVAHFELVEWIVRPDLAIAAAALQKGEVDWIEQPLIDLCQMLRKSPDVLVAVNDPFGWQPIIALNDLTSPFNNPRLRRALLPALDQKAWFGWPTDEKLETLRDAWFDTPDLASQKSIAEQIQLRGLETLLYLQLGQIFQPTAFRSDIEDIVKAMFPLFWGVRRG